MQDIDFKWWWLSYANDHGFLGVVILTAPTFIDACKISASLKLSPGGEVIGWELTNESKHKINLSSILKLLNKKEALELVVSLDEIPHKL